MTKVTINGFEFTEVYFKTGETNNIKHGDLVIIGQYTPKENLMLIESSQGNFTAHKEIMHYNPDCDTTRFILNIVAKTE